MSRYYYLISSLPALPGLGEKVLLGPAELREQVAGEAALAPLIDLVLLEDDLFLRQSVLAGEQGEAVPAVLSPEQVSGEQPLPSFVQADEPGEGPLGEDPVWEAYFRHVDQQGRRMGSAFLQAWAAFEVGLRNRLVQVRAKALEFERARFIARGSRVVMYLFHTNGQFCPDRTCVRVMLGNPADRHAYFSKVELTFGSSQVLPTREQAIAAGTRFMQVILPVLVSDHWPDWDAVKRAESSSPQHSESESWRND